MKKMSLRNMESALTKQEMKKIMAGSSGLNGCGFCTQPTNGLLVDCVEGSNDFGQGCVCPYIDAPGANVCHN